MLTRALSGIVFVLCATLFSSLLSAASISTSPLNRPLVFEPNRGQTAPQVKWTTRGPAYQVFIADDSATFALWEIVDKSTPNESRHSRLSRKFSEAPLARVSTLRMTLKGSSRWNAIGLEPTEGVGNYLMGNDSSHWRTDIPQYSRLKLPEIYPGIDLVFYGTEANLEYDFVVAPGADPTKIRLAYEKSAGIRIDDHTGDLVITTPAGAELRTHRPSVYQEIGNRRVEVAGEYAILHTGEVGFKLGAYDRNERIVIDPTVSFTTFIEGSGEDFPNSIAVDSSGNSYITGFTFSFDYPQSGGFGALPGKTCTGPEDNQVCPPYGFITKLSSTGGTLFSTLFGGSSSDFGKAIAVDFNSIYVVGVTSSSNFTPALNSSYHGGAFDGFAMKLSLLGNQIDYSVLIGGSDLDSIHGLAVDPTQTAVVVGLTHSTDFPTSSQAMQKTKLGIAGTADAFITKLSPAGAITYSTYLGGSDQDEAHAVAVDGVGSVYVTGETFSTDFPNFGTSYGRPSGTDSFTAFYAKIVPNLAIAVYSIYIGGGFDRGNSIKLDTFGNVYIAGETLSPLFPTTGNAFQVNKPTPPLNGFLTRDAFVVKLNSAAKMMFATYLGGTDGETTGESISINASGQVYVAGTTSSTTFPGASLTTPNPTFGYLVKFDPTLGTRIFTFFLGAEIKSIAIPVASDRRVVVSAPVLTDTVIYTTGARFRPNSDVSNVQNIDAFVVKVNDPAVVVFAP